MKRRLKIINRLTSLILFVATFAVNTVAQQRLPGDPEPTPPSAGAWPYVIIFIILTSLGVVYSFWRKSKKSIEQPQYNYDSGYTNYYNGDGFDTNDVDAYKELEWLRKAKRSASKSPTITYGLKQTEKTTKRADVKLSGGPDDQAVDTKVFQEKMKMLQYAQLPINSFIELTPAKKFEPLPDSNAKNLLKAIAETNEELEPDEAVRELAIKTLASFRTSITVDALSQIALYDLSSSLRAKAVTVLADFDHESVFEAILLACADPTREVRAAAARGLFRLNFDRSGAWKRLIETKDDFRMSQAVRAAIESSIVTKSFDRLVHEDLKIAYEAFTLVALVIKSGEDNEIFEAITNHKDERVRFALLHVIKAIKDERSLAGLNRLRDNDFCSPAVLSKVRDVIKTFESVSATSSV